MTTRTSAAAPPPLVLSSRLCLAALVLALPVSLASLPLFAFGYWNKAESLPLLVHATAILGSLGLILGLFRRREEIADAIGHPQVLLPAAVAAWTVAALPFAQSGWLSLAGTIQSGLGGLWFLDMAVLIACALVVRRHDGAWLALRWWAVAVSFAIAACKFHDWLDPANHLLIYVAAYYGWNGLALAAMVPFDLDGRRRWALPAAGLAAAALLVLTSLSVSAIVLLPAGVAFAGLYWVGRRRAPALARFAGSRAVAVALVLMAAFGPHFLLRWMPALGQVASLHERRLLIRLIDAALAEQSWSAWLFGHGSGQVQNACHTHLNILGEVLWQPTWSILGRDYFHAHNWMLETLYATGLPGLLLGTAALVALPLFAAPERRAVATALAATLAVVNAIWFPLAPFLPFLALATAAVSDPQAFRRTVPWRAALAVLALAAAVECAISLRQTRFIAQVADFRAGRLAELPADPRGSDLTASEILRDDTQNLAAGAMDREAGTALALAMIRYVDERVDSTTDSHFLTTALNLMARIYMVGDLFFLAPHLPEGEDLWRRLADRLMVVAPRRTDPLIAYLTHQSMLGRLDETRRITEAIIARSPHDAVGLYFSGLLLVLDPAPEVKRQGLAKLRESVRAGIERFMPLDPALAKLIGSQNQKIVP